MSLDNYLKKYKETPEEFRKLVGLAGLLAIITFTFFILNNIIGENKIVKKEKIVENEETVISLLPSGRLNFYESSDGYQLSPSEYEAVCKNTKIVAQRAMMGALITNIKAQKLYTHIALIHLIFSKRIERVVKTVSVQRQGSTFK